MDGLGNAPDGLHPAEGLLDLLSPLLRQGVARVPGGSAVDGGSLDSNPNVDGPWTALTKDMGPSLRLLRRADHR
jgi:hypothetical protein